MSETNINTIAHLSVIPPEWERVRQDMVNIFGKPAILAGGSVRDHLLGIPINDLDVFILDTPYIWRLEAAKTLQRFGIEAEWIEDEPLYSSHYHVWFNDLN